VTIETHVEEFGGLRVRDFVPAKGILAPETTAYRVALDGDEMHGDRGQFADYFAALVADPNVGRLTNLVLGPWGESGDSSAPAVEMLVAARQKLSGLTGLFPGDIIRPEQEISWITQSDLSALWAAFPKLEELRVRGGSGLRFGKIRHDSLRSLVVETGGLAREVVAEVARAKLPALEHLELWFGEEHYGGNATAKDLQPFLTGERFPKLKSLALRNFRFADELAEALAKAPVLRQLHTLDLSLGTLGDEGARALLKAPGLRKLKKLDLHHHYLSVEMMEALRKLPLTVDVSDRREPAEPYDEGDNGRYVAVAE
jgi:hypothetical protein